MRIVIALLVALVLGGCAAATDPPSSPSPDPVATVDAPAPAPVAPPELVPPTHTQDSPAACTSPRFVSVGVNVKDATTGLEWIGTDIAYPQDGVTTAGSACALDAGYRPATTAEVLALTSALPGCQLPAAFHAVYVWATLGFFPNNARPIVTSDGCVDVKTGTSYVGDCAIPGIPPVSRSTLCVK